MSSERRKGTAFIALILSTVAVLGAQTSLTVNRVVWVQATGTGTENCAALRAVLSDLAGATSASERHLVKLEPGEYQCGTDPVEVPSFVTLEGAGSRSTQIFGSRNSDLAGVVHFDDATDAAIRSVRVHHFGGDEDAVAISANGSTVTIEHVFAFTGTATTSSTGLRVQSDQDEHSVIRVRDSALVVSDGLAVRTNAMADGAIVEVDVFSCELEGNIDNLAGGSVRCAGSYRFSTYDALNKSCIIPP